MENKLNKGIAVLPGNTYDKIPEDIKCPIDTGMIVCHKDVENDIIEAIVTAIWEQADKFRKHHSALSNFERDGMTKEVKLEFHPAAAKFYRDKGILK
jgi:TRAP-type uncharacterized transport system substrate-binding protein